MITLIEVNNKKCLKLVFDGYEFTLSFDKVIQAIDKILAGNFKDSGHGICVNLQDYTHANPKACQYLVGYLAKNWEHFSGKLYFPIPATVSGKTPNEMYVVTKHMWSKTSKYGKLRWELLQHIRDELVMLVAKDDLKNRFTNLLDQATSLGFTVTVEQIPNKPLMMGNTSAVVSIRRSRGKY